MISQQRDYESRSLVMQQEQAFQFHELFNQLTQLQAENMRAFKEFTTLQDARYGVEADYNINGQIKLSYIADHLHNMEPVFPTYDEYFKGRSEREVDKALLLEDRVKETMKKGGFWQKLTGKSKGETSKQARDANNKYKYLRRGDITPEVKGWYELVKRSILGTVNTSEVNKKRAVILYCIIVGGEVKVHEIIASDIQRIAEKNSAGALLHYPSTIMRLCMKAKVPMEDANPTWLNPGLPVTFERMMIVTESRRPQKGRRRGEPQEEPQGEQEEQQQF
ncbi:hypothetical protein Ahy_B06g082894 isoform B [Arachis hypogaea]|uniref:Putative plant transposon protein domain-containing protein n=1 Tax=Arachis hypogaea TaxID=3818 RepID=A0A444YNZ7_ARAHY|nr:hypothetical protein Ahy_B06g082894 isoform B [Arachis hypogaea]